MDVCLIMFKGDLGRREFPVTKNRIVIGRVNSCELRIPLSSVSRKHCELKVVRGVVKISDLGSSNGTFVNGTRIRREASLHPGDRIQVGPVVFTLVIDGIPKVDSPSESLVQEQITAELRTGNILNPSSGADKREDEKTTLVTSADVSSNMPASFEVSSSLDQMDDSAVMILPDDEDDDEQSKAKLPPKSDSATGGSVMEEFDSLLEDIEGKAAAELGSMEQLDDADLIEEQPAPASEVHDDEVIGEIDEEHQDDHEELMVLTDDDDEDLPVLDDNDGDPVAALQAMSSADDSASDSEDDIDISWITDEDAK